MRLSILGSGFRRGPRQAILAGLVVLAALALTALLAGAALVGAARVSAANALPFVVLAGTAASLLFVAAPFGAGGRDELEPRRLLPFAPSFGTLAIAPVLGALLSWPVLVFGTALLAVGCAWLAPSLGFGILVTAVALLALVLLARSAALVAGLVATSVPARRRGTGILIVVGLAVLALLIVLGAVNWRWGTGFETFTALAVGLGWTPFGAPWSAPLLAAQGQWEGAWGQLGVLVATLVVAAALWVALVRWSTVAPRREHEAPVDAGLGWFDRVPDSRAGAIAARSLTYWLRDDRYRAAWGIVPVFALLTAGPFLIAGMSWQQAALIPLPLAAWLLAWLPHNDVASDHSAFWLHVSSGVDGAADRLGRIVPPLVIGVPVILLGTGALVVLVDLTALAVGGLALGLLLAGLGVSSVLSVRIPYATVEPGRDPFRQPQLTTNDAMFSQFAGFAASAVVVAPALVALFAGLTLGAAGLGWLVAAAVAAPVLGVAALAFGLRWGARRYDRRGPELLSAVQRG